MILPPPETLRGPLVTLRPPTGGDADAILRTFCDGEASTRFVGWRPRRTEEEARRFLARLIDDGGKGRPSWVIVRNGDGRAVGFIVAAGDGEEAETSYTVEPAAWNRGIASAAVALLAEDLLSKPGVVRVRAICDAENGASARVLEKAGFRRVRRLPGHCRHNISPEPRDGLLYLRERPPGDDPSAAR
jgi:RimJ/RimL family protein N-acetyltransferase